MAAFNKFEAFVTAKAAGTHANALNADTDVLAIYLTNNAPSASLDSVKTDLTGITVQNGYTGSHDTANAASTTGGVITVAGTDVVITASGGTVGPFRYAVLFNETAASDPLIGWWDYGSSITLNDGESFTVDFGATMFTDQ